MLVRMLLVATFNLVSFVILLFPSVTAAKLQENVYTKPPVQIYTVVKGDTLWDIAAHFYSDPWVWKEIWAKNPELGNPHLIYPGDEIHLSYRDGQPVITVKSKDGTIRGGGASDGTLKLQPQIRVEPLSQSQQSIPVEVIKPYLQGTQIIELEEYETAPYVVAAEKMRLMSSSGDTIYVKNLTSSEHSSFSVVELGKPIVDPDTNTLLGYAALDKGDAELQLQGELSSLLLKRVSQEVQAGDRIVVLKEEGLYDYQPLVREEPIESKILSTMGGQINIGPLQVVAIRGGKEDGVKIGELLSVYKQGRVVRDSLAQDKAKQDVHLPDIKAGELMVFRTFNKMSLAVVMTATDSLNVSDRVAN